MHFFFDESGTFSLRAAGEHNCSVVCGVVVPETVEDAFSRRFQEFVKALPAKEKKNDEPKGHLLSDASLEEFCRLLNCYPNVLVTPTVVDLTLENGENADDISTGMKQNLLKKAELTTHDTLRVQVVELARQWGNLSPNQSRRLVTLATCFGEAIQHSVIFHTSIECWPCWDSLQFHVDPTHRSRLSREERVFEKMVLMWLCAWSKNNPLETIEEIHTESHPFVKKFTTSSGNIDLGAIIQGNILYPNSADSWGIQVADISAYIIFRAVLDLSNQYNRLPLFGRLMRNCPYGPGRCGPGLIVIGGPVESRPAPKFGLLGKYMFS